MQDLHFAPNNDYVKLKPEIIPLSLEERQKKSEEMRSHRAAFMDCGEYMDCII